MIFFINKAIKDLEKQLENPELSKEQKEVLRNTINEWSMLRGFKIGDNVFFLYRRKEGEELEFTKGKVVKKSSKAPLVGIRESDSKNVVFLPPSMVARDIINK